MRRHSTRARPLEDEDSGSVHPTSGALTRNMSRRANSYYEYNVKAQTPVSHSKPEEQESTSERIRDVM